jgi:hypothetical protein
MTRHERWTIFVANKRAMWDTYLDCKTWGGRPSQKFNWPCFANRLTAWKFDQAVLYVGLTIENALQEREPDGDPKEHKTRPKYKLAQLLDPDFKLPRPKDDDAAHGPDGQRLGPLESFVEQITGMAGPLNPNVRLWQYVPPADDAETEPSA